MATNEILAARHQIICEGPDDIEFFSRLLRDRGIGDLQANCGRGKDGRCLGKDGFRARLSALKALDTIRGVIIVADCDDDPKDRFSFACTQLRNEGFPVPDAPNIIATTDNMRSAVLMLPAAGVEGGLETLLLSCCPNEPASTFRCVNTYCECLADTRARKIDKDKLRLRSIIAALNPDDPSLSLGYWLSTARRPFAMNHTALDEISHFLQGFTA